MKKVALVGFSQSTRMEAPWDDPEVEIWGLNEGYVRETPRISRWFQLHNFNTFSRANNTNDPKHFQWLKDQRDFPIYMQKDYRRFGIKRCKVFPLDAVTEKFGRDGELYATSSFSYMIYLAMLEGFDWIGVYGFEMATGSEYFHQRANAEYIIGMARGMGITVALPQNGNLLRGRMYAYEDESLGIRQNLEFRLGVLAKQMDKQKTDFYANQGKLTVMEDVRSGKLVINDESMTKMQTELINSSAIVNTVNGAIEEVRLMLRIYDSQQGAQAVEDELKKEISPD